MTVYSIFSQAAPTISGYGGFTATATPRNLGTANLLASGAVNLSAADAATANTKGFNVMAAGEAAARELAPRLAALALPEQQYASMESLRLAAPADADRPVKLAKH